MKIMRKTRKMLKLCLVFLTVSSMFTGCKGSSKTKDAGNEAEVNQNTETEKQLSAKAAASYAKMVIKPEYSNQELSGEYDKATGIKITLADDKTECKSDKVRINGNTITILQSGTYILQGKLNNGKVLVDSTDNGIVQLVLSGVDVTSSDSAPIYVKKAKETIITLAENTTNTFTDAETYIMENEQDNESNAAIFSKDDLTINGSGTLVVNANYNHGIQSKDNLRLISGTIFVNSAGDGIVGKDSVIIKDADIRVCSSDAGIKATNIENGYGYIYLDSPVLSIDSMGDGLHSDTVIQMDGGDVTIQSGDDGIHADIKVLINGGTLKIEDSYEGIEGCMIVINDGNISIYSDDDGINASNGTNSGPEGGMFMGNKEREKSDVPVNMPMPDDMQIPENMPNSVPDNKMNDKPDNIPNERPNGTGRPEEPVSSEVSSALADIDVLIEINGGTVYVNASGDGIDSNGSIVMNGGDVRVDGPENGGNGALDYDSDFQINGGTLIAVGNSQMAMAPSEDSGTNSVYIVFENYYEKGTNIVIKDMEENELISYTPSKKFNALVFSDEKIEMGMSYAVYADDECIETITVSNVITTSGNVSGDRGNPQGGNFKGNPKNNERWGKEGKK
ncbi:MAG: carbohydrate-binding domain-containing protein [Lachnospiraceae bacterium]|nr:carbohydrate-binding domain-containing protein [Lachnospiraceae bacterium]